MDKEHLKKVEEIVPRVELDKSTIKMSIVNELVDVMVWDPSVAESEVAYDMRKIKSVFAKHFKEAGLEKDFTDKSGLTLYKTMATFTLCDLIAYTLGKVSEVDLINQISKGVNEHTERYELIIGETAHDWVTRNREFCWMLHGMKQTELFSYEGPFPLSMPDVGKAAALNAMLKSSALPSINFFVDQVNNVDEHKAKLKSRADKAEKEAKSLASDVERLQSLLSESRLAMPEMTSFDVSADGTIPEGKMVYKKASEIFPDLDLSVDFSLPYFEWEGEHPNVPKEDPHYIFRTKELTRCLYGIVSNKRVYLPGHTGTGKTTLIEQICAKLKYPFVRVNFDSEITRSDLIGSAILKDSEQGNTVSEFIDGVLPTAMSQPCILCCDEIDFVRPDVAYVMQSALEGNGLRVAEDGDRTVTPHPMFRMFATGNTVGQGDEEGMYQGARPQSMALLDRFTVWCRVDYLTKDERLELVKRHEPTLSTEDLKQLSKYMEEHLSAFLEGNITQPISPRGMLAVARATTIFGSLREALEMTVLDRASASDRATLVGLIDRVCK